MSDAEIVLTPGEVARRLGMSPSGLRRLATVYTELYGKLGKDSAGARIWTPEAVRRLEAARTLMAAGRARSIKDALQAVEAGVEPSIAEATALGQDGRIVEALGVLTARLEAVLDSNERLEGEVAQLRAELQEPRALPPKPWERPVAFGAGDAPESDRETPSEARAGSGDASGGVLVRLARRLERILGRRG